MAKTNAHKRSLADAAAALGNRVKLHSGDPGTNGANLITTSPAYANTTWAAAVDGSGGDAGKAVVVGSAVSLQIPVSTTATHYGIFSSGDVFLRGGPLANGPISSTSAGAVTIDVTPVLKVS
ncbi:hypothetical protein SEA_JELLYBONES_35 [Gordonia phage Jellybones]|uniref:Uncharacterized protein n=1 Tax=Gordonia phage Jellybones TaxID=2653716 RepID=A0A5Q2WHZ5_9CAUD|nr:hypothetical protein HWC76_gp098 [Gordonia phage Jellybones]QGH76177.1 hypothetical protein SEA_JELLYBONES_35 [Gordonia phage Jellybones]